MPIEKRLEDFDDLTIVAERRDEPVLLHDAFRAEIKRDGTPYQSVEILQSRQSS